MPPLVAVGMDLVFYYVPGAVAWLLHGGLVVRHRSWLSMESPCAASSAATMMRVRVSLSRVYSGQSDFYGDNARSCCLSISLARCSGVSD